MSLLNLLTLRHIGEIADWAIQLQPHGRENVFVSPYRRNGLGRKLLRSLCSHLLLEASNCGELRAKVGENLPQTGLGKLSDVDSAEAPAKIVEAVAPLADLRRHEAERIAPIADPPIHTPHWRGTHV